LSEHDEHDAAGRDMGGSGTQAKKAENANEADDGSETGGGDSEAQA
jgi:hypothetical protein